MHVDGDFSTITDRFTLEAWIKLDKYPTGKPPFWTSDVVGKLDSFVMTVRPPGVLYVGVQLGPNRNWLVGHTRIPLHQWTQVALVHDGPARKIGTFVNGVMDLEADVPPGLPPVNQNPERSFFVRSYGGTDEKLVGMPRTLTFGQCHMRTSPCRRVTTVRSLSNRGLTAPMAGLRAGGQPAAQRPNRTGEAGGRQEHRQCGGRSWRSLSAGSRGIDQGRASAAGGEVLCCVCMEIAISPE